MPSPYASMGTGAASGAGSGALAGSAFGPVGMGVGAVGGGLLGAAGGYLSGMGANQRDEAIQAELERQRRALSAYQGGVTSDRNNFMGTAYHTDADYQHAMLNHLQSQAGSDPSGNFQNAYARSLSAAQSAMAPAQMKGGDNAATQAIADEANRRAQNHIMTGAFNTAAATPNKAAQQSDFALQVQQAELQKRMQTAGALHDMRLSDLQLEYQKSMAQSAANLYAANQAGSGNMLAGGLLSMAPGIGGSLAGAYRASNSHMPPGLGTEPTPYNQYGGSGGYNGYASMGGA